MGQAILKNCHPQSTALPRAGIGLHPSFSSGTLSNPIAGDDVSTGHFLVAGVRWSGSPVSQFLDSQPPPLVYFHHPASLAASQLRKLPPSVNCSPKRRHRSRPILLWWNFLQTYNWRRCPSIDRFLLVGVPCLVPGTPVSQFLDSQPLPLVYFHHGILSWRAH